MTNDFRNDFPLIAKSSVAYLDNAATAQRPQCVLDAENDFYLNHNANPLRGLYPLSVEATEIYENAREAVRAFLNARSAEEIIFTRNTTESLNLVAYSYGLSHVKAGDEVLVSIMEHHSDLLPWQMVCRQTGARLRFIECEPDGSVDLNKVEPLIGSRTKVMAMTQVSNVLGRENPIRQVAEVAHRAGAALGPENTLEALEASIEAGADMAEVDVRLTREGVPVLLHDQSLGRTVGVDREIGGVDLGELEAIEEETGHEIPTLERLLAAAKDRISLMLDLKAGDREERLAEETAKLVEEYHMEEQCVIASTEMSILERCRERIPQADRLYITRLLYPGLDVEDWVQGYSADCRWAGAAAVVQAGGEGRDLYLWTVNGESKIKGAAALGVQGIITDDPGLAVEILEGN